MGRISATTRRWGNRVHRKVVRPVEALPYRSRFDHRVLRVPGGAGLAPEPIEFPDLKDLPEPLRDAGAGIVAEAELVLGHRMRFVSDRHHDYGDPIAWQIDPETGDGWPQRFHLDVQPVDPSTASDPIRVWELSRGHQLLTLARAARLAPERSEGFLREMAIQLDDWIATNPTGCGVNWGNAMEAAIRATNWIWAVATAGPSGLPPATLGRVTVSLQQHARFIRENLEGDRFRRGNHFLADLLGLAAVGCSVTGDPGVIERARFAARRMNREIERQVNPDGGNFEGSGLYHGLVLEILTLSILCLDRIGIETPDRVRERVERMIPFALAIRHPNGRSAQYGDSDSGRILPAGFDRPPSHDAVIWTASSILGLERPLPGKPDPEVAWNLGLGAWEGIASRPLIDPVESVGFPQTGIYVLSEGGSKVVADCGPVGQAGFGGHAHNDALSFEWSVDGQPVIVDPGTFSYTGDPLARDEMRSTAVHPTPRIDGEEINPIRPQCPFRIDEDSPPFVTAFWEREDPVILETGHDAYLRLHGPVAVRRRFTLHRSNGVVEVTDRLEGSGEHSLSMPLPLLPGVEVRPVEDDRVRLRFEGGGAEVSVEGAAMSVGEGPYSAGYGLLESAPRLMIQWRGEIPHSITIRLTPDRRPEPSLPAAS